MPTHKVDHKEHGDLNGWTLKVEKNTPSPEDITADLPKLPRCEVMSLPPKQVSRPLCTPLLARMEMSTSHGSRKVFHHIFIHVVRATRWCSCCN